MEYGLLLAAVLFQSGDFAVNKNYQKLCGISLRAGLKFNAMVGLFSALIFWMAGGFQLHFSWYSLVLAVGLSASVMFYNLIGFRIMSKGSMALYTLFLMTGGMMLPFVCGLVFWGESFSWWRMVGIGLILAANVCTATGKTKLDFKVLLLCAAVFVFNGCSSIFSKLHQIETVQATVSSTEFVVYTTLARAALAGLVLLFVRGERQTTPKGKAALMALMSASFSGMFSLCQLLALIKLPATVQFPFITGGIMVCSTVAGMVFFKEKPGKPVLIGVVLSFIGTLFFL